MACTCSRTSVIAEQEKLPLSKQNLNPADFSKLATKISLLKIPNVDHVKYILLRLLESGKSG